MEKGVIRAFESKVTEFKLTYDHTQQDGKYASKRRTWFAYCFFTHKVLRMTSTNCEKIVAERNRN